MKHRWRTALWLAGGLLATAAGGLFLLERAITHTAVRYGDDASRHFGGDRVHGLIALVECEGCMLWARNRAVWALGQLEEAGSLPALERSRTGGRCHHATGLCQYEIEKAIRKIRRSDRIRAALDLRR